MIGLHEWIWVQFCIFILYLTSLTSSFTKLDTKIPKSASKWSGHTFSVHVFPFGFCRACHRRKLPNTTDDSDLISSMDPLFILLLLRHWTYLAKRWHGWFIFSAVALSINCRTTLSDRLLLSSGFLILAWFTPLPVFLWMQRQWAADSVRYKSCLLASEMADFPLVQSETNRCIATPQNSTEYGFWAPVIKNRFGPSLISLFRAVPLSKFGSDTAKQTLHLFGFQTASI